MTVKFRSGVGVLYYSLQHKRVATEINASVVSSCDAQCILGLVAGSEEPADGYFARSHFRRE